MFDGIIDYLANYGDIIASSMFLALTILYLIADDIDNEDTDKKK